MRNHESIWDLAPMYFTVILFVFSGCIETRQPDQAIATPSLASQVDSHTPPSPPTFSGGLSQPTARLQNLPTSTQITQSKVSPTIPPIPTLPVGCGTVTLGSPGTQSQDDTRTILIQGNVILCGYIYFPPDRYHETISIPEAMIDLDNGSVGTIEADLEFFPSGGSMIFYYLVSINGARSETWSYSGSQDKYPPEPTYADCRSLANPFSNDNEPEYVCVLTNMGNVSRVKVEQYNPLGNQVLSLEISFITWEE
jgi:hypothetical protein